MVLSVHFADKQEHRISWLAEAENFGQDEMECISRACWSMAAC